VCHRDHAEVERVRVFDAVERERVGLEEHAVARGEAVFEECWKCRAPEENCDCDLFAAEWDPTGPLTVPLAELARVS